MREYHFNGKYNKWALVILIKDQVPDANNFESYICFYDITQDESSNFSV